MTDPADEHRELEPLLGAYALDALDTDEQRRVTGHLEDCPRCRAEVDAHRETAGALGNLVEAPPPALWDRIAREVELAPRRPDPDMPPLVPAAPEGAAPARPLAPVVPLQAARPRRPRALGWAAGAVAAAAVVVIALLAVNLGRVDHQVSQLQQAVATQPSSNVAGTTVALRSSGGVALASFTVYPDGRGVLEQSHLDPLGRASVYQLWGITGGSAISLGLMGRDPRAGHVAFTWNSPVHLSRLAVTVEPAGGAMAPTTVPVASSAALAA